MTAVLLVSGGGTIAGALVGLASRSVRAGIASMLELWMAASLLRLSADESWASLGTVAAIATVRVVLARVFRLSGGGRARAA